MACQKCNMLKGNIVDKFLKKIKEVPLGRGTIFMSRMRSEFKESSAILGFPCIYYIGNKLEPMEYRFISCCPICGEKNSEIK